MIFKIILRDPVPAQWVGVGVSHNAVVWHFYLNRETRSVYFCVRKAVTGLYDFRLPFPFGARGVCPVSSTVFQSRAAALNKENWRLFKRALDQLPDAKFAWMADLDEVFR